MMVRADSQHPLVCRAWMADGTMLALCRACDEVHEYEAPLRGPGSPKSELRPPIKLADARKRYRERIFKRGFGLGR